MTAEETFEQMLGLGKAWCEEEARLEAGSLAFLVKVEEMASLLLKESGQAGSTVICHDQVERMQWRHLNVFNKECLIVCAVP